MAQVTDSKNIILVIIAVLVVRSDHTIMESEEPQNLTLSLDGDLGELLLSLTITTNGTSGNATGEVTRLTA